MHLHLHAAVGDGDVVIQLRQQPIVQQQLLVDGQGHMLRIDHEHHRLTVCWQGVELPQYGLNAGGVTSLL